MWAKIGLFLAGIWTLIVLGAPAEFMPLDSHLVGIAILAVPLILAGCALTLLFTVLMEGTAYILRRSRP